MSSIRVKPEQLASAVMECLEEYNEDFSTEVKAFIVALVMAILSPVMAVLNGTDNTDYLGSEYKGGEDDD